MNDRSIITRKLTLIPTFSDRPKWEEKVMNYTKQSYIDKIAYYKNKLTKTKEKEEKQKIKDKLASLEEQKNKFEESGMLTQTNVTDYTYDLVRNAMASEAIRKNAIISYVILELLHNDGQTMDFNERNKLINDLVNYGLRVKGSSKGSLFDELDIENPLNSYGFAFKQDLKKKIRDMVNSKRVLDGKSSVITYKADSPFSINKDNMSFTHDYDSFEELCDHIRDNDTNLYFNFGGLGNPTIARFKINLGAARHKKNKDELIATLLKMYSGEYQFCGSRIGIEKNKIILNLVLSIPKKVRALDENTVVGVNLGVAVPAMCALNNNEYERLAIGSADEFLRVRTKLQAQRRRLQKSLKDASGGHGRTKKLKALERVAKAESHFANTYCHMISKRIVDFALKNNAKYINLENLTGYDTNDFILRNWSYYKMQQYTTYKAEKYGIIVRKVNPCYNAQACSVCGNYAPGQRKSRAVFICANPACKSHRKNHGKLDAEFNNARNVAMSTLYMNDGQVTEKSFKEARDYFGIEEEIETV